jgi:Family of unknown function (DUF5850)
MKDLIIAILGITLASVILSRKSLKENFWGLPNRTVRKERLFPSKSQCDGNMVMYSVPPNYQSTLEPRFSNVNYGANIRCNLPREEQLGVPAVPLDDADPMTEQVINYDRLIFANQKSRLNGRGDPIRGDLPIVPINDGWFRPSVNANIDLRQGAINIIAGNDNSTSNALRALQDEWSGKTVLFQKDGLSQSAPSNLFVTAFP